jgi:hypothetical protein
MEPVIFEVWKVPILEIFDSEAVPKMDYTVVVEYGMFDVIAIASGNATADAFGIAADLSTESRRRCRFEL